MKKIILTIMVVVMAISSIALFAACDAKDPNTLYISTNCEFAPFESLSEGKPVGFDIDMAYALAKEMGYEKVEILDVAFTAILGDVQSGKGDIAIAALTISPEKQADWSDPYFNAAQVVIYKGEAKTFENEEALQQFLNGKKVGVCMGYSGDLLVNGLIDDGVLNKETTKVVTFDNGMLAVEELLKGTGIECVVIDKEPAKNLLKANEGKGLVVTEQTMGEEEYGIMVKQGNKEMLNKVNAALKAINEKKTEDGTKTIYDSIYSKYFN